MDVLIFVIFWISFFVLVAIVWKRPKSKRKSATGFCVEFESGNTTIYKQMTGQLPPNGVFHPPGIYYPGDPNNF